MPLNSSLNQSMNPQSSQSSRKQPLVSALKKDKVSPIIAPLAIHNVDTLKSARFSKPETTQKTEDEDNESEGYNINRLEILEEDGPNNVTQMDNTTAMPFLKMATNLNIRRATLKGQKFNQPPQVKEVERKSLSIRGETNSETPSKQNKLLKVADPFFMKFQ